MRRVSGSPSGKDPARGREQHGLFAEGVGEHQPGDGAEGNLVGDAAGFEGVPGPRHQRVQPRMIGATAGQDAAPTS
jgi:hypothetical protein